MELIRISERKLKIMLTPTDMCHFELNNDCFGEDSTKMHQAFRLLLDEVRRRTDFEGDDRHLSIQYSQSREGGCEMFISQLCQTDETVAVPIQNSLLPSKNSSAPLPTRGQIGSFRRDCAFRFTELNYLLHVCNRLLGSSNVHESHAYRDERNDYFLFLTVLSASPFSLPKELDFLVEYGNVENAALLRLYIQEHATLIASPDAIGTLGILR